MAKAASEALLALTVAVAVSGCGTAMNLGWGEDIRNLRFDRLSPEARVYGGVLDDVGMLHFATVGRSQFSMGGSIFNKWDQKEPWEDAAFAAVAALLLIDLPISTVGDTLTLPLTAYVTWKRQAVEAPRSTPSADGPPGDYPCRTNGSTSGRSDSSRPQNTGSIPGS